MIEVEIKFQVTPAEKELLLSGATFKKSKVNDDDYYDTADFALIQEDQWLRDRNGSWELKIGKVGHNQHSTSYNELEDEGEIKTVLGIESGITLSEGLKRRGIRPFVTIHTKRESYERDGITFEFDEAIFNDDTANPFIVTEAEIMATNATEAATSETKILGQLKAYGIEYKSAHGKCSEYFRRYNPAMFEIVLENWQKRKSPLIKG